MREELFRREDGVYTGAVTDIRPKDDTVYYFKELENKKFEY